MNEPHVPVTGPLSVNTQMSLHCDPNQSPGQFLFKKSMRSQSVPEFVSRFWQLP